MTGSTDAQYHAEDTDDARHERADAAKHRLHNKTMVESATTPANGAAIQQAQVGTRLAAEERSRDSGETAEALKRAIGDDKGHG